MRHLAVTLLFASAVFGQKYTGPRPPKPDVVYLVHADNLVATDAVTVKQESKKNETQFTVDGTGATAKTPLAEPIFLIDSDKIQPQSLELYRFDVKGGHREVTMTQKRTRGGPRPLRLTVTRLDGKLYRIEADEELENGQYGLSPNGSNTVFCFEVY
ncbi:MAG: hypothetical protein LAO79_21845 [Acidobacteriia bacterium]|nr:hypothetical protein [Terriglobia bacterium]